MNAYEIPNLRYSLPAGGAVKRGRFVSVDASGNGIQATASTQIVGASMNEVKADQVLEVADGIVMVEAAGSVTAGALVYADAEGKATASGTVVAGIAITTGAVGGYMAVKIR